LENPKKLGNNANPDLSDRIQSFICHFAIIVLVSAPLLCLPSRFPEDSGLVKKRHLCKNSALFRNKYKEFFAANPAKSMLSGSQGARVPQFQIPI